MAALHLLAGKFDRDLVVGGLRRARGLRQRPDGAVEQRRAHLAAGVQPRDLMADDRAAVLAGRLIEAGLLRVPVRVDERVDAARAEPAVHGLQQQRRVHRVAAIDQQRAVRAGKGDHVAAAACEQREPADVLLRDVLRGHLLADEWPGHQRIVDAGRGRGGQQRRGRTEQRRSGEHLRAVAQEIATGIGHGSPVSA